MFNYIKRGIIKRKTCQYCNGKESLYYNKENYHLRELYIEGDKTLTVSVPSLEIEDDESINIKINYCPMCGNKL